MDLLLPENNRPIWTLSADAALEALGSGSQGLDAEEVERRLAEVGPNRLPERARRSAFRQFLAQFESFLALLLIGAAVLAFVVGDTKDAVVILGVVLFNAVLGFVQEHRAESSVAALGRMLARTARVRRAGQVEVVASEELIPGDVVLLEAGERVPADGRILEAHAFEIDESSLTGESSPVVKRPGSLDDPELPVADRVNLGFMNTVVTRGRGELLVAATGEQTEMGRLATSLATAPETTTPLQQQVDALGRRLALIAGVAVVVISAMELARGQSVSAVLMEAVAIAVAAIPEGLPAVVTVTLALGMNRMAREQAIVKRMSAVETLGCTTDICSDKTGTLTLNEMTATEVSFGDHGFAVGDDAALSELERDSRLDVLVRAAALCNDSSVREDTVTGDPTEVALWVLASRAGVDVEALRAAHRRVGEVPFEAERKFSATVHADGMMYVKGAPDVLLERCASRLGPDGGSIALDERERTRIVEAIEELSGRGLRVLAFADCAFDEEARSSEPEELVGAVRNLVFVGLVGLVDPPRPEARDAIAACRTAGISVRMITGDHAKTGLAIAKSLGILGEAVDGRTLDKMDDRELGERLPSIGVFARVAPEHKLRIVEALRAQRRVVAMIGDGVNDAPALKRADIGVAMGITGTEVSQEAATLVLANDNFATIVGAVREGRTIYDNIVRFLRFQLSTNFGALLTIFFAPILGLPSPFTPLQILWVNVIMDGPPAMALGLDPPRGDIMEMAPRDPDAKILTGRRLVGLLWFAAIMAVGTLSVLAFGLTWRPEAATTLAFTTFVLFQVFNVSNARFERMTALGRHSLTNYRLWVAIAAVVVLQALVVHVGFLQDLFGTVALTLEEWGLASAVAASILVLEELRKLAWRLLRPER